MWRDASGNKVSRFLPRIFAKSVVPLNLDSSRKGFTIQAQQVLPHLFRSFWDRYRSRLQAVSKLYHFFWVDFSSKKIHVLLTVETCAIFFKKKKKGPAQTCSNSIRNFLPSSSSSSNCLTNKPTPSLLLSNKMKQNPTTTHQPTIHQPGLTTFSFCTAFQNTYRTTRAEPRCFTRVLGGTNLTGGRSAARELCGIERCQSQGAKSRQSGQGNREGKRNR